LLQWALLLLWQLDSFPSRTRESWGCDISEQKVQAAADAMVEKGLLAAGYSYLNLDDCWMAKERATEVVAVNETLHLNNTLQAR
jgi:hypothetical protein